MPDMQAENGQPIYFWNRLLKAVVLQKPDFFVLPFMQSERRQKNFKVFSAFAPLCAVSQIMGRN